MAEQVYDYTSLAELSAKLSELENVKYDLRDAEEVLKKYNLIEFEAEAWSSLCLKINDAINKLPDCSPRGCNRHGYRYKQVKWYEVTFELLFDMWSIYIKDENFKGDSNIEIINEACELRREYGIDPIPEYYEKMNILVERLEDEYDHVVDNEDYWMRTTEMDKYFFKLGCNNFTDKKWETHIKRKMMDGGLKSLLKRIELIKKIKTEKASI